MEKVKNETLLIFTLAATQFSHVLDFVIMMPLGPVLMRTLNIDFETLTITNKLYDFGGESALQFLKSLDKDLNKVMIFGTILIKIDDFWTKFNEIFVFINGKPSK